MVSGPPVRRARRYGQNFLADPNLLQAIVRGAEIEPDDVVLEVGAGSGALTERLVGSATHVHAVELDRALAPALEPLLAAAGGRLSLHWGDAMKLDLGALDPAPVAMVANLPYSIAAPLLIRTLCELPRLATWTVMVQLEIAQRFAAEPGSKLYGAPSAIAALAAEVEILRRVDRAVFVPRPRVDSAVMRMMRTGPPPSDEVRQMIRDAFAHRRKTLPRSLELSGPGRRDAAREALESMGLPADSRAEALSGAQFAELAERIGA